MHAAVALFAIVMGVGIAAVWTQDLVRGSVDFTNGPLRAREPDSNSLLWPHWLAEYGTAATLVMGSWALLTDIGWGDSVTLLGLGACAYTSTNSLGWALARPDRRAYRVPMFVGAVGAVAASVVLVAF